jgi:SAM-dependent methyltransferase
MLRSEPWKWDQIAGQRWHEPDPMAYYLAARWTAQGRRRFLDLGCGVGRHALFFARQGFVIDAFDLSPSGIAALEESARGAGLAITARVGDMLSLPYPNGQFDCLMAFHVIYHSDRAGTEKAITEIVRVLAPGGEAYITFNSRSNRTMSNPANVRVDEYTCIKTDGSEANVPHYYVDAPEVRRLLSAFDLHLFEHREEFRGENSSWHYYTLCSKP